MNRNEILYSRFRKYQQENLSKFYTAEVHYNEHPYYERLFYTIIQMCKPSKYTRKKFCPSNLIPQFMFIVTDKCGENIVNCKFPDFLDPYIKVVIEIDGAFHNTPEQKIKDKENEKLYKSFGYKVYRLKNEEVAQKAYKLLKKIYKL